MAGGGADFVELENLKLGLKKVKWRIWNWVEEGEGKEEYLEADNEDEDDERI